MLADGREAPGESQAAGTLWRNRYWVSQEHHINHLGTVGPGEVLAFYKWPSRDIAETKGQLTLDRNDGQMRKAGVAYLGAEFFRN